AGLARISYIMAVHPSVPARTVAEFIDHAKANPGRISFASGGVGSSNHLSGELFRVMAGIVIVHVPYRGHAAVSSDLLSGRVQLWDAGSGSALAHVRSGALRGLAVTSRTPLPTLPEMPTVAATVTGYEASAWYGFGVPRTTPAEIVTRLNREVNAVLAEEAV